jgi:hypothetical protein
MRINDIIVVKNTFEDLVSGKYYKITEINGTLVTFTLCTKLGKLYKKTSIHLVSTIEGLFERGDIDSVYQRKIFKLDLNDLKEKVYNEDRERSTNIIKGFINDIKDNEKIVELLKIFDINKVDNYTDEEIKDFSYKTQEIYYTI